MAGVAINGSEIVEVTKSGHVTYTIENYECVEWDDEGFCTNRQWKNGGSGSTGAKATGAVSTTSKIKLNGVSVARVGDMVNYTWIADPPVPSNTQWRRYVDIAPATSGSGTGTIASGSSKGRLGGQPIALIGSQVTLDIGVTTTIADGNNKLKFDS